MVCPMLVRMYAAGLVVIIGVFFALVPNQAFARSGGFGGRAFSIGPGFRSPVVQRSLGFRSPALNHSLFSHRHRFGYGAPLMAPYGPYYDGGDYADPYYQSSYSYPDGAIGQIPAGFIPPLVHHRGCESESVTVPAERNKKRSVDVNIVRCY
jgi:hypothetical protein